MNGELRDWYLETLGVVRYVPRDKPAGEQASHDARDQEYLADFAGNEESRKSTESPAAISHIDSPAEPKVVERAKQAVPTPPEAGAGADGQDIRVQCRLAFWQPSGQLIVLSTMPPGVRPGEAQTGMLANLLKAIRQLDGGLPPMELLDWPLSPGTDSSLRGARELLTAFLDVKHQLKPFSFALLMGEMAAALSQSAANPVVGDRVPLTRGAEGIVTYSLHEMDQNKSLKRDTWDAIRFLAGGVD